MLIKCPECELQVSDRALVCPHCGYPMKPETTSQTRKRSSKRRRRLPNGFGQITEIKNRNLRKPFRAMITVGKTDEGKPVCKPLKPNSYFETYNDAYEALINYHKDPYSMDKNITLEELYERWKPNHFKTLESYSAQRGINAAWKYCHPLYKSQVATISPGQIKECINNAYILENGNRKEASSGTKSIMKSIFNMMFDYGLEFGIIDKNIARNFKLDKRILKDASTVRNDHMTFTEDEMKRLWDNLYKVDNVDIMLIQCYSGCRPQELGIIEVSKVDLNNWTFVTGVKTDAGINRTVPIHTRIRTLIQKRYDEAIDMNSKYLLTCTDSKDPTSMMTYAKYNYRFMKVVQALNLDPEHKPHDGRKHFITMAKKYNVDEYAIKYIVGHAIDDITEKIYTDRPGEWLSEEIEKIK